VDPRERADAALARARARGTYVVTPEDAVSPMDATNTLQIPRSVVTAADDRNGETTMVISAAVARGQSVPLPQPTPETVAPEPKPEPETRPIEGLVTVHQPAIGRSSLSRRLDGE
jgi:hypothetical protein